MLLNILLMVEKSRKHFFTNGKKRLTNTNNARKISENSGCLKQTVNARELYGFLGSKQDFSTWIKNRIDEYGFVENQDFASFSKNLEKPVGGRPSTEYALTLDMAKELSMVERTEQAKELIAELDGKPSIQ